MDKIFLFDKNPNRARKILPKLMFDPQYNPSITIIKDRKQIYATIATHRDPILYYICGGLDDSDRVILNLLTTRVEDLKVILLTHEKYALLAWDYSLFDFKKFPITVRDFHNSYNKYSRYMGRIQNYLPLKTREGLFKIPVKNISFLKADGAYTVVYRNTGEKKVWICRKLKEFENLFKGSRSMKRLHNSYIINVSNIRFVGKDTVSFYGKSESLTPLSRELGRRIRKVILKK